MFDQTVKCVMLFFCLLDMSVYHYYMYTNLCRSHRVDGANFYKGTYIDSKVADWQNPVILRKKAGLYIEIGVFWTTSMF